MRGHKHAALQTHYVLRDSEAAGEGLLILQGQPRKASRRRGRSWGLAASISPGTYGVR